MKTTLKRMNSAPLPSPRTSASKPPELDQYVSANKPLLSLWYSTREAPIPEIPDSLQIVRSLLQGSQLFFTCH